MKPIGYIAVFLTAMSAVAFTVGRVTAPPAKIEANSAQPASETVRHIPITRATARHNGDPNNQLSPVYPANPGKDLPAKDVAVTKPTEIDGNASAQRDAPQNAGAQATAPQTGVQQTVGMLPQPPKTCHIQACENAYRSFRASDCSYQPYGGPRQFCTVTDGGNDNRQAQSALPPQSSGLSATTRAPERLHAGRDDVEELRAVEREVRRLPPPPDYDVDGRRGGIVVIEAPDGTHYSVRRNWIDQQ